MKKLIISVMLISLMSLISCAEDVHPLFKEVDTTFKLNGKPIHPKLIQEFEPWLSDRLPVTISVDVLEAEGTNEYSASNIEEEDGSYTYTAKDGNSYTYRWLGRLRNGLHVVRGAVWGGGGSGVFSGLLFVKFSTSKGLDGHLNSDKDIKSYDRILMTIVCNYGLQDRYSGEIKLQAQENKVIVQKGDAEQVLDFNNAKL